MANLPVVFDSIDAIENDTLRFSYVFDVISKVEKQSGGGQLPIQQATPIKALALNLEGRTSNPNMSISIHGETHLFTLQNAYITDTYPHAKDANVTNSFVIEGFSIKNVNKERVLLFIPMTTTNDTKNIFYPLEQHIIDNTKPLKSLTFDDYIPTNQDSNFYSYFQYTDTDSTLYRILYFKKSTLQHTSALNPILEPFKNTNYTVVSNKLTLYKTSSPAKRQNSMNSQHEDNIYIDCVPVEIENKKISKYMQYKEDSGSYYTEILMILVYIVILSAVVAGIIKMYYWLNPPVAKP